jgi:hypothetical protein
VPEQTEQLLQVAAAAGEANQMDHRVPMADLVLLSSVTLFHLLLIQQKQLVERLVFMVVKLFTPL